MPETRDVVIIGGGHNGLVAAAYLAKAGFSPLVLERRETVGGAAVTEEIHPGFRCPTLAHSAGPLLPHIARELDLERHGARWLRPQVRVLALSPVGKHLPLYDDPARTATALARHSEKDAQRYGEFHESLGRIGRLARPLLSLTPPSVDAPEAGDVWKLLKLGKDFRRLPRKDAYRLLRWGPMAVADLVSEWFQTELLRAAIAARGIYGMFGGPWSAGTGANLLVQAAIEPHSAGPADFIQGGMGALTAALAAAARGLGAEIRCGSHVARVDVRDGQARGVVLSTGEQIPARAVVSNADPKRTFLSLIDPTDLDPDFLNRIRNFRSSGAVGKVNLALAQPPRFQGLDGDGALLSGRIHIGPEIDYLERAFDAAKYGAFSPHPYCDVTIPTVLDPSLAPAGAHVMSVTVQYAPERLREGDWASRREAFGDAVVQTLEEYAPGLSSAILARQVITPRELEDVYGLTGGHIFHGEQALDQIFTMRPLLGWARYRTPIPGLYLCGAGTHPGGRVTGAPGSNAAREIAADLKRAR
ncbi:MAG TPA: NAD(P)/FAD-dependent oxidoreductase [Thermoanaerobaculia bacterium]|nr:NAD(P)/FAD-dependent oxidoreductase [Thermoanaerobaculia bacterium]